jgi:hypothetical protein
LAKAAKRTERLKRLKMASSLALGQATALGRIFLGLAQKLKCLRSLQGAVDAFGFMKRVLALSVRAGRASKAVVARRATAIQGVGTAGPYFRLRDIAQ